MRGGKYLGEGTYGCTLDPAPKCMGPEESVLGDGTSTVSDLRRKAKVGKVFVQNKYVTDEWSVAQEIAAIDPKQLYFIYPIARCPTTPSAVRKAEGSGSCTNMSRIHANKRARGKLEMVLLPNGGVPLNTFVMSNKVAPSHMLRSLLPVFKGIQKLAKHNIVHHDMKFDNILYNAANDECRIIDFGLKVPMADALKPRENRYMFSNYWLHPPEYRMIVSMYQRQWKPLDEQDIRQFMTQHLGVYKIHFNSRDRHTLADLIFNGKVFAYCDYERAYILYLKHVSKQKGANAMLSAMQRHPEKIDVFSLGITLVYLSMYLDFAQDPPAFEHKFFQLIRSMLHPDPRHRASPTKCIRDVMSMLR